MRVFKTKTFSKWAMSEGLGDKDLSNAIKEIEQGLIDAKLGGGLCKKRVAIGTKGKSGGLRTLIALRVKDKAFFIYGFAKSQRSNISRKEKAALKLLASELLSYSDKQLDRVLGANELLEIEVCSNE